MKCIKKKPHLSIKNGLWYVTSPQGFRLAVGGWKDALLAAGLR